MHLCKYVEIIWGRVHLLCACVLASYWLMRYKLDPTSVINCVIRYQLDPTSVISCVIRYQLDPTAATSCVISCQMDLTSATSCVISYQMDLTSATSCVIMQLSDGSCEWPSRKLLKKFFKKFKQVKLKYAFAYLV